MRKPPASSAWCRGMAFYLSPLSAVSATFTNRFTHRSFHALYVRRTSWIRMHMVLIFIKTLRPSLLRNLFLTSAETYWVHPCRALPCLLSFFFFRFSLPASLSISLYAHKPDRAKDYRDIGLPVRHFVSLRVWPLECPPRVPARPPVLLGCLLVYNTVRGTTLIGWITQLINPIISDINIIEPSSTTPREARYVWSQPRIWGCKKARLWLAVLFNR